MTPGPNVIKQPREAGLGWQIVVGVLFAVPAGAFIWCWHKFGLIHFENPALNLGAHAALILVPLAWCVVIYSSPMEFVESGEILVGRGSFFKQFPVDWWMAILTLAAPLFAFLTLIAETHTKYLPNPDLLATSPMQALLVIAVSFGMGLYCCTVFTGSSEPRAMVSDAGFRNGMSVYHPWEDIAKVRRRGNLYVIYHRANPSLPATCFAIQDDKARAIMDRYLAEKNVVISGEDEAVYLWVRAGVLVLFLALMAGGYWVRVNTKISLAWLTLGIFLAGCGLTLWIERYRGVHRYKKLRPVIES